MPAACGWPLSPAECGVSTFTVRTALGRVPPRAPDGRRRPPPGQDPAGVEPAAGEEPAPGAEVLPVLPDPVAREPERALARFGLLGEGAAPVFTPGRGIRWPGCCWRCRRWSGTGLLACARTVYGRLRNGFYGLRRC